MDNEAAAAAIFNNSPGLVTNAAPAPQRAPEPAVSGDEAVARKIFDADTKPAYEDVFTKAARERQQDQAPKEQAQPDGQQKPAQQQQAPKTPEAIQAEAAKLVTDLQLDASDPMAAKFSTVATEIGIDKDKAAKLVAFDTERRASEWARLHETWTTETTQRYSQADIADAKAAYRMFADDATRELFDGSFQLGNHPAIVGMLARAGAALRKAGMVR